MPNRPNFGDNEPGGDITGYIHDPKYAVEAARRQAELGGVAAAEAILSSSAADGHLTPDGTYRIEHVGNPTLDEHVAKVRTSLQVPGEYVDK